MNSPEQSNFSPASLVVSTSLGTRGALIMNEVATSNRTNDKQPLSKWYIKLAYRAIDRNMLQHTSRDRWSRENSHFFCFFKQQTTSRSYTIRCTMDCKIDSTSFFTNSLYKLMTLMIKDNQGPKRFRKVWELQLITVLPSNIGYCKIPCAKISHCNSIHSIVKPQVLYFISKQGKLCLSSSSTISKSQSSSLCENITRKFETLLHFYYFKEKSNQNSKMNLEHYLWRYALIHQRRSRQGEERRKRRGHRWVSPQKG